jgi:hypothetical protein
MLTLKNVCCVMLHVWNVKDQPHKIAYNVELVTIEIIIRLIHQLENVNVTKDMLKIQLLVFSVLGVTIHVKPV